MKNREDAEEVTQDVLMKVHRKIGAFRGDSALSSWIYRITFNTSMSRLRNTRLARAADAERDRTLLAQWVGSTSALLAPLTDALRKHVFAADVVHADDTPIPVLAPGGGKTKTGRLWTYVRDERPSGGTVAPAVWFTYTPDRRGEHPQRHLEAFTGILQADGYAGFSKLYDGGRVLDAALSQKSATARAIRYALSRWEALGRFATTVASRWTTTRQNERCGALHLGARIFFSRAVMPAASEPQQSTVCWAVLNATAATPKHFCARSSRGSPNIRSTASRSYCPGI